MLETVLLMGYNKYGYKLLLTYPGNFCEVGLLSPFVPGMLL